MIQINIGDHAGSENGDNFTPIPAGNYRDQCRWARRKAIWISQNMPRADQYYSGLGAGVNLTTMLGNNSMWINYDGSIDYYGYTYSNNDIWIGPKPFRIGKWSVLATILHELAHVAGAPGAPPGGGVCAVNGLCHAAERAVYECGLGNRTELTTGIDDPATPYDPTISG
ncbi:hypothetical protein GCM10011363_26510 [Marivita lacus]|uniref:Lysine-specific metallo-endopeptidase domain-containing protein n=1 Tax=Marivita lacus TaxID=1323742 RepID=A0ABQ1KUG5_9RHOB|nr:hypothetical protein [Marivita lacus]MDP4991041.1 hypothetical protein [Marivita lacus]GGC08480.1 hypothetical protein GCM10011363_26510 [Marivita lacus]